MTMLYHYPAFLPGYVPLALAALVVVLASLAAALILGSSVSQGSGATFTVTKTADTADGVCGADCSLREAIIAANALAGADTINVPAGPPPGPPPPFSL